MYDSSKIGRRHRGEGYLGTQLSNATRFEYGHQDGSRDRGLSAYRIRIQQSEVSLFCHAPGANKVNEWLIWLLCCGLRYHLKDVIVGKIYFLLVRIKIEHMELSIIRRETTGSAPNMQNESETITKFEIMDGAPARGEEIVRVLIIVLALMRNDPLLWHVRRDYPDPVVLGWIRLDPNIPGRQQEVLCSLLP